MLVVTRNEVHLLLVKPFYQAKDGCGELSRHFIYVC
jgi:hypothetical protein